VTPPTRYNVRQAAKLVGKSPSWMYQKGAAGQIPRSKLGHHVWWTEAQIAEILRSAEQPAKPSEKPKPEQKRQQQPPRRQAQPKRQPAQAGRNSKIPQADFGVSRLYRADA
jgi:predicted DNA-binding transcriptional regulator AlpA